MVTGGNNCETDVFSFVALSVLLTCKASLLLLQLEEFLDSGLANTSGSEQLVRDHIQAVQAWGFDFEWMCEIPEQHS